MLAQLILRMVMASHHKTSGYLLIIGAVLSLVIGAGAQAQAATDV
jgi:hypothetical protein